MSGLKSSGSVFIATWGAHTADDVRRGTASTSDGVVWAGTFAAILAAMALTLVFTDHRFAPFVVTAVFPSIALGVAATHLAPGWGYFSEPLIFGSTTDRWALVAAIPEIFAALWIGWNGLRIVSDAGYRVEESATA